VFPSPRIPSKSGTGAGTARAALAALVLAVSVAGCSLGGADEGAVARGDLAFARDSLQEALAEYRLAVRQGDERAPTLARVAHTYVRLGRVDEARNFYAAAVEQEEGVRDQAAADFAHLAREAAQRDDAFQMASAMDAALSFRPGLSIQEMALPLARHYFGAGEYGRALPFYQKALAATPDSTPDLVFEIGQAHEQIGDCQRALVFFEQYRSMVRFAERDEVDWYIGNCSFQLARGRREAARRRRVSAGGEGGAPVPGSRTELLEAGLRLIDRTLELGEPRNLLGRAWFERGEILAALGDCEGALEAFDRVRFAEPTPNTPVARRAAERYDQIYFGRGLRDYTSTGSCG
jgi:tetratricopeptide (TPR) repeat protein